MSPARKQGLRSRTLDFMTVIFPSILLPTSNDSHPVPNSYLAPGPAPTSSTALKWGLLGLTSLVLVILLAGCGRGLGGSSSGWSPAAVSEEVVYVGTKQGEVKALLDNGSGGAQIKWTFPSGGGERIDGVYNTPVVGEDLIYVSAVNGNLYALDKATGVVGWRRPVGDNQDPEDLVGGPAVDPERNMVVVGSEDGNLYAYDAKTGDLLWPFETGDKIWSTPVIRDGVVYFGSQDHNVYALSLEDGQERWRFSTGGAVIARPLLLNDTVVIGSFDKKLYGIDVATGDELWQIEGKNWFFTGAVARDGIIYAPSMDGNVYALDEAGNLLWKYQMGSAIVSTPALVSRGLVVAGENGRISLLDDSPGDIGPEREVSSLLIRDTEVKSPLVAQGDSVFVGAQDSTVRRIEVKGSQVQVWCFDTKKDGQCN